MATLYKRIKDMRIDRDLTQQKVAADLGYYTTQYQLYERGERPIPIDFFIDLALYYNISLEYLTGLTDEPRTLDGKPYKITK